MAWIISAATRGSSCSHTRTTAQVANLSLLSVSRSRRWFPLSFSRHQSPFAVGQVPCLGQQCQKQESTKTATRARRKTTSASRRSSGRGRRCVRYRRPRRCSSRRKASSGWVSRRRWLVIRRSAACEETGGTVVGGTTGVCPAGRLRRELARALKMRSDVLKEARSKPERGVPRPPQETLGRSH